MAGLDQRLYAREGRVELRSSSPGRAVRAATIAFGVCVAASVGAGLLGMVEMRYLQPLTALYFVPFAVFLTVVQRPQGSYLMLLWPGLYLAHAILLVAGAPILFQGRWEALNLLLPTLGYGLLAALLAHLYSRYALCRLQRIARETVREQGHGLA